MQPRAALGPQTSSSSSGKQVVELNGYVIILVEGRDGKIKLYGSPADKDNLEVADEILDVNERKLEDLPRAEVIRHIHECIQSCMIKLRVKRRSDSRLAGELGNAVQDAFVIAVEQQARERLQRLSALKRVTPVDMSQLSIKLNQQNHTKGGQTTTHDLSFLKEASPIYVTSLTSNHLTSGTSTITTAAAASSVAGTTIQQQQQQQLASTSVNVSQISSTITNTIVGGTPGQIYSNNNTTSNIINSSGGNIINNNNNNNSSNAPLGIVSGLVGVLPHQISAGIAVATPLTVGLPATHHQQQSSSSSSSTTSGLVALYPQTAPIVTASHHINTNNKTIPNNYQLAASGGIVGGVVVGAPSTSVLPSSSSSLQSSIGSCLVGGGNISKRSTDILTTTLAPSLISNSINIDENLKNISVCHNSHNTVNSGGHFLSNAILPNIVAGTGPAHTDKTTITGIASIAAQNLPIVNAASVNNSNVVVVGGGSSSSNSSSCIGSSGVGIGIGLGITYNTNSSTGISGVILSGGQQQQTISNTSATNSGSSNYNKHHITSTNNQLCNYNNLSNNISNLNNNNLLINNLCNNNNSNNISNCGAGNNLNSFNSYGNSNCDLLLANGNPPRRELSTLSEGDSEPLEDSNISLYDHQQQQQLNSSNSSISKGGTELLLGDQSLRQDTRPRRRSGSSIVVLDGEDLKPRLPDDYINSHHIHPDSKDIELDMLTMLSVNQDNGPYREKAVDVPSTFIARNKTPPRYPPPRPPVQLNGSVKPVPPPRDHLRMEKDGRMVNRAPAPQVPDRKVPSLTGTPNHIQQPNHQIAQIVEPTTEQLDSIKKYQEQLRRRREEEERIAQQNEFLRASLRGSRKLQALQDSPVPQPPIAADRTSIGVDNDAYADDEEPEKIIGYGELVGALQRLQSHLNKNGFAALAGRVTAAQNLLLGPGVAHALAARTTVLQRRRPRITNPICSNAQHLSKDVVELMAQSNSTAAIELGNLLTTHEFEGLLQAHDRVASLTDRTPSIAGSHSATSTLSSQRTTQISSHLMNNNILKRPEAQLSTQFGVLSDGSQDHIRIIQIEKSSEPLGATVRNESEAVVIARIVRGGAADKSGLLHEGDEILEVNGIEMRGKTVNDVCTLLGAMTGTLTFLIVPAGTPPPGGGRECAFLHVRSHFDYDPEDDMYIPCRELGISFQKGDVLHVISRDDANWWQAYREGEEDQTLAGLIPSQSFQHQRETMKLAMAEEAGHARSRSKESGKGATLLCARKGRKKKKKASSEAGYPLYATTAPDEPDPEEILTYEEVALYYPRAEHKRPIVLIGPPNIGRHELRQRLMADSDRFAAAVPHTSRSCREGEIPGQDYHFITRAQFEADILARKFVEHGEYEKAYYGTSLEAIRTVVASGKICVLNLHPQSLKLLRASDLKPYVVLVAPPSLEKLKQKKVRNGEPFKEEELKEIIATARDMEARWGHLFDMIIINNDTERAYHKLLDEINILEREPQWVPACWVQANRQES